MKKIVVLEPYVLCKKIELQDKVGSIIIPGQEERVSTIKKVVATSTAANHRNIRVGDIVVTRAPQYPVLPVSLTENDQVPHAGENVDSVELIDPAQILALYREDDDKEEVVEVEVEETNEGE